MKGALMLETHLKMQVTLSELAEDRQAQARGFTKARVMSEAQPDSCFLDNHTANTKLIKRGGIVSLTVLHLQPLPFFCPLSRAHNSLGAM